MTNSTSGPKSHSHKHFLKKGEGVARYGMQLKKPTKQSTPQLVDKQQQQQQQSLASSNAFGSNSPRSANSKPASSKAPLKNIAAKSVSMLSEGVKILSVVF